MVQHLPHKCETSVGVSRSSHKFRQGDWQLHVIPVLECRDGKLQNKSVAREAISVSSVSDRETCLND